jgi:iron transport multicopper oxidase
VAIGIFCALGLIIGLSVGLTRKHGKKENAIPQTSSISPSISVDPAQQILASNWNVNAPMQVREYNWTVSQIEAAPGGAPKALYVINGISPGPLVEANLGDNIVVHVTNTLNTTTSIHWHGQYQNGTNAMDGTYSITECGIAPGSTFTYNWTVQNVGTYWYHAHRGLQYSDGMYGPLILHSPTDPINATYAGDQIVMAADLYDNPAPTYMAEYQSVNGPPGGELGDEPVPDCGVVNGLGVCAAGQAQALMSNLTGFEANKTYRFRFINAGSLGTIRYALDGHTMTVIEADGTAIEPQEVQSLTAMVAQRYSVLITMNQKPGAYALHADLMTDMFGYDNPALVTEQKAMLYYVGVQLGIAPMNVTDSPQNVTEALDDSSLVPLVKQTPPVATKQDTLTVTFELDSSSKLYAFLNGSSWTPTNGDATLYDVVSAEKAKATFKPQQLVLSNNNVTVWDLIINNEDDGAHPVHLHGYNPWILGSGTGHFEYGKSLDLTKTFDNPMRRDTFAVPTYGWAAIRVVLDNPGIWALHCHIAWHMEVGFMEQLNILPDQLAAQPITLAAAKQCGMPQF